jgi:hypothetical protein
MRKDPEALKIMQMRRLILSNLNRLFPIPLQIQTLYRVLCGFDEHYTLSLLDKDVAYLRLKDYIEFKDAAYLRQKDCIEFINKQLGGSSSFEKKFISLTAAGKEIADNIQTDSALEI